MVFRLWWRFSYRDHLTDVANCWRVLMGDRWLMSAAFLWLCLSSPASAQLCLSDEEIEDALGDQVRSSALLIDTRSLPDRPLCSNLTIAQHLQKMRAAAFPEEVREAERVRSGLIAAEQAAAVALPPLKTDKSYSSLSADLPKVGQRRPTATRKEPVANRKKQTVAPSANQPRSTAYYRSCSAARAAGAAPIRRGSPGYGRHLDRDGDGIACE